MDTEPECLPFTTDVREYVNRPSGPSSKSVACIVTTVVPIGTSSLTSYGVDELTKAGLKSPQTGSASFSPVTF